MKFQKLLLITLMLFLTYSAVAQENIQITTVPQKQIRFGAPVKAEILENTLPLSTSQPPRELANNAEVILISGQEAANQDKTGTIVNVDINRPGSKVLLILMSIKRINWKVNASPSTKITGIVVSEHENASTVTTTASTKRYLVKLPFAYARGNTLFKKLLTTLHYWLDINKLDVFRGSYAIPNVISISTLDPLIFADLGVKVGVSANERLKSCDPNIAIKAAEEIINNPDTLKEPLELFGPAAVLFQHGKKNEAVFWFTAAELRVKYQLAFETGDRGQLLTVMRMVAGPPVLNYAFQDIANYCRILDRVLEWDKKAPNPFRERPQSESVKKQIEQIYVGLRDYKTKLVAEKSDIEDKAKKAAPSIERTYIKDNNLCQKGQLDPAYVGREIEKEKFLVENFVANNKEVIKKAKGVKKVSTYSYNRKPQKDLPFRYIVSVHGSEKQPWEKDFESLFVFVDVSRQKDVPEFKIACMEFTSNHVAPLSIISGQEPCGKSCWEGRINCSGVCVIPQADEKNCGACGIVCPQRSSCVHGQCTCVTGLNNCSNNCVNLQKDVRNCGACGVVCPEGSSCDNGKCVVLEKTH